MSIKGESRAYFRALGAPVALLRKSLGMTQAELARAIGVSQQAVFAYELGGRRISVFVLGKLSRVFKVPVEDLMGMTKPARASKSRLSPRAMRHGNGCKRCPKPSNASLSGSSTFWRRTPCDHRLRQVAINCRFFAAADPFLKPRPSLLTAVTADESAATMRVCAASDRCQLRDTGLADRI